MPAEGKGSISRGLHAQRLAEKARSPEGWLFLKALSKDDFDGILAGDGTVPEVGKATG